MLISMALGLMFQKRRHNFSALFVCLAIKMSKARQRKNKENTDETMPNEVCYW
jgi:hypothetical protein